MWLLCDTFTLHDDRLLIDCFTMRGENNKHIYICHIVVTSEAVKWLSVKYIIFSIHHSKHIILQKHALQSADEFNFC